MRKRQMRRRQSGQALVEYAIIVIIVAILALTVIFAFSDQIRALFSGATEAIGGTAADDAHTSSEELFKSIGDDFKQ